MKKCYVISEYGGGIMENKWVNPICVFLDEEKAKNYVESVKPLDEHELEISVEEYNMLMVLTKSSGNPSLLPSAVRCMFPNEPRYTDENFRNTENYISEFRGLIYKEVEICE